LRVEASCLLDIPHLDGDMKWGKNHGSRIADASPHRRCVPAPAAAGGASVHCVARPCTGGGASLHRLPCAAEASCAAVENRKNDLEGGEGKPSGLRESLTPGGPSLGVFSNHPRQAPHCVPASRPLKARHTGWGGSSEDAIPVTRVCSCIACLALTNSSSTLAG